MVKRLSAYSVAGSNNILKRKSVTVGTSAVQALLGNSKRVSYRIYSKGTNTDNIYHGHDNKVDSDSEDVILPGGILKDEGEWQTIYRGEVWLISGTASQTVTVEEIIKR